MKYNRFLSLLIAFCMLLTMVPFHAHAAEEVDLDTLVYHHHARQATRQIRLNDQGDRLVEPVTQAVLPTGIDYMASGTLDDVCQWAVTQDGYLYIRCDGQMPIRASAEEYPWFELQDLFAHVYIQSGSISANAFAGYQNIQTVECEEGLTAIGENAFAGCGNLYEIWFYGSAVSIASNAFTGVEASMVCHYGDTSWDSIFDRNFGGSLEWFRWISHLGIGDYGDIQWTLWEDGTLEFYGEEVPMASQTSAQNYPWYPYADRIVSVYFYGVTSVGDHCFAGYSALLEVVFDASMASIGNGAFRNCSGFAMRFDGNAPSLGQDVFTSNDFELIYSQDDPTWTREVLDDFYGTYTPGDNELPPVDLGPDDFEDDDNTLPDDDFEDDELPRDDYEVYCGMTAQQVYDAMMALQPQYPEGMHWTNDDYYAWNGGYFSGGYGCAGFAFILSDAAFGYEPSRFIREDITIDDIRVGDILRINNDTHSVIVLEVYPDHIVVAEGNYNSSIHWGRVFSDTQIAEVTDYIMTRYPEHSWNDHACLEARTCSVCGLQEEAPGHSWINASCTSASVCSVCGVSSGMPTGHKWLDATCSTPKTCSVCGAIEGAPTGQHVYDHDADTTCNECGAVRDQADMPANGIPMTEYELEVLRLTNKARLNAGLNPLTATQALQLATDVRAQECLEYFSHTRPDGRSCFTVLAEFGLTYHYAAENIAKGYQSPASVMNGWMNSEGHQANILTPALGHMGVGEDRLAWVQLFTDAGTYSSIRVDIPDNFVVKAGTSIDDMGLVAVLRSNNTDCWLPLDSAYCTGYDPNATGSQTVQVHVLGVTCSFTLTMEGGHVHTWIEATCSAPRTCSECGKAEGAPLNHTWLAANCQHPMTCVTCGATEGEPSGHSWLAATCQSPMTCVTCGVTEGEPSGHSWLAATCQSPMTCVTCGVTEGEPGSHIWDNGVITAEPSADTDGECVYTCITCGETRSESIPSTMYPFVPVNQLDTIGPDYKLFYDIPEGGAAVLIFFSHSCGNSQMLMSRLDNSDWAKNPYLNLVAVNTNSGSEDVLDEFINTYAPNTANDIEYYYTNSSDILFDYYHLFADDNSVTWPLVLVVTDSEQGPVIRYGATALTNPALLNNVLTYVSSGFAGWDGQLHTHTWQDATCDTPKTCTTCGETDGEALGHDWAGASCESPRTCTICSKTDGEALGHNWTEATCDAPRTCATCGKIESEPAGHSWIDASCNAPKTCSVCGKTEGSALEHHWVEASCAAPKTCILCDKTEGEALAHNWVDATCDTPKTCSVCSKTEGSALEHGWVDATCNAPRTCFICGKPDGEALGHDWLDATCSAPKSCNRCHKTEGDILPHDWKDGACAMCGLTQNTTAVAGDADGDGVVSYMDAMLALQCAVGLGNLSAEAQLACDVDLDGMVTYMDAMLILQCAVGLIPALPVTK